MYLPDLLHNCLFVSQLVRVLKKRQDSGNAAETSCKTVSWPLCQQQQQPLLCKLCVVLIRGKLADITAWSHAAAEAADLSECMKHRNLTWAAQYNTWLLIKLMPRGKVFSVLVFSFNALSNERV